MSDKIKVLLYLLGIIIALGLTAWIEYYHWFVQVLGG